METLSRFTKLHRKSLKLALSDVISMQASPWSTWITLRVWLSNFLRHERTSLTLHDACHPRMTQPPNTSPIRFHCHAPPQSIQIHSRFRLQILVEALKSSAWETKKWRRLFCVVFTWQIVDEDARSSFASLFVHSRIRGIFCFDTNFPPR